MPGVVLPFKSEPPQGPRAAVYPFREVPHLHTHVSPIYCAINAGPKLEKCIPAGIAESYCQLGEAPALGEVEQHDIQQRLEIIQSIWTLIQACRTEAQSWKAEGKKRKREGLDKGEGSCGGSTGPVTRSQTSATSSMSRSARQSQGRGAPSSAQGRKWACKLPSSSLLTKHALSQHSERLHTRTRSSSPSMAISKWASRVPFPSQAQCKLIT